MSEQRLTAFDEFPRHQTTGTFNSVASDSPNWSDGYYFTLGDRETGASLFAGLRLYSNTDVIDGFACVTDSLPLANSYLCDRTVRHLKLVHYQVL